MLADLLISSSSIAVAVCLSTVTTKPESGNGAASEEAKKLTSGGVGDLFLYLS